MVRFCVLAGLIFLIGLSAPAAKATPVGISEQHEEFMAQPLFKDTNIGHARRIVGWDVLSHRQERHAIDRWMFSARLSGLKVMVSFGYSRGHPWKRPPSPKKYRRAVKRFMERYRWVDTYSAWNEPNLHATRSRPELVARYWGALYRLCPQCTLIGAEVADTRNMLPWLRRFRKASRVEPGLWGLHNYHDANRFQTTNTEKLLKEVAGRVWLTETGGIIRKNPGSKQEFPSSEEHQTRSTRFLLERLAPLSERIDRVYLYHWTQEQKPGTWDSGLVRADGTPRKAYYVVKKRVDEDGRLTTTP